MVFIQWLMAFASLRPRSTNPSATNSHPLTSQAHFASSLGRRRPTTAASHANQARRGSQAQPKKTKKSKTPNKQKTTKNQKTPKTKKTKKTQIPPTFSEEGTIFSCRVLFVFLECGRSAGFWPLTGGGVRINLALCRINPARVLVCSFACM